MNFDNEKYEYLLTTWGGFYNDEHKAKHGLEPGSFWFNTPVERKTYLNKLKNIEKKYGAKHLAHSEEEGKHVRYKTIARMILVCNGKEYPYECDFGFAYPVDSAHFMWEDGNYSCDCNKSLFLSRLYPEVEETDCGDEIEVKNFTVSQEKSTPEDQSGSAETIPNKAQAETE